MKFIYLHGFASGPGSQKARFLRERFAGRGVELLVPDLAEGDFEHLTISRQLGVVERTAAGEPCVLIGSSLGGYLAALYAARHPEAERAVLYAPAFGFEARLAALIGPEQMERWRESGWRPFFNFASEKDVRLSYGLIEDARKYEAFPDVRQPVLILHGTRDDHVPVSGSEEFISGRPNARLVTLDTDHQMLDALDRLWEETWGFVAGSTAAGSPPAQP
ncbi:MAG: alpha/beta hydrolase [bacterium]|jgi:pimeloyl-ACP methyl ester carboxylesterase